MSSDPGRVGPFERWGHLVYRRRRWVLAVAGVFLAFAATWGTGVFGSLISSGFETPGSESARALAQAEDTVGRDAADVVVLYRDGGRSVDDPRFRDAVEQHLADLPPSLVKTTTTWWSNSGQLRRNTDRRARHRHTALCLATTILIIGKLLTHQDRWSP